MSRTDEKDISMQSETRGFVVRCRVRAADLGVDSSPGKNGQLNRTPPFLWIQDPFPVLFVGLAQKTIIIREWVCLYCISYDPPA